MTTSPREPASTKVEEVLESGQGTFDLTRPPSRAEAGLPAGRAEVIYQREDRTPLRIQVALPGGVELAVEARLVGFDARGGPDPTTGPPTGMDIQYYAPTLQAGRDHLLAAADQFGFDTKAIQEWYDEASGSRPVQAPPDARTPWLSASLGYLRLEVQGGYSPSPADQTVVHYALAWGPGVSPQPS